MHKYFAAMPEFGKELKDKQKEKAVVSLLGAVVPLPVTINLDNVKVIRREEGDEEDDDN